MKRSISLVLCLAMLISVFSCMGLSASAADEATVDPTTLFTVKSSGFKNDKITYTVYLKAGVKLSGAIVYASFDSDALAIDKANSGAYMVDDGDGGERENIGGMYEADFMAGYDNKFSIAHAYEQDSDYKVGSSNKAYMRFTFKAIDDERPKTSVRFYCYEFNSSSTPENNIANGSSEQFYLYEGTTLGKAVITSLTSEEDGVKIKWDKVTGADYYRVYKIEDGVDTLIKSTADGDETSYTDANVSNNNAYTYAVRAVNEASFADEDGNKYPAEISDSVSTRYTIAPKTLTVTNDDGKVIVEWSKVSGAEGYRVYRRTVDADGDVSAWEPFRDKVTKTEFSDDTVTSGKKYEYAVRVYSDGGYSALYSEKEIVYLDKPDFSVKATVKGVKITWDEVAGAESYRIYRKTGTGSWKKIKTVSSSETSYLDKSASSGKKNYYLVKAVNSSYTSDYDKHSLTYIKTPEVSVKNITTGVNVSWSKVSGATSYEIYRKAGSASSWTKIKTTKSTSYTDKSVKSGSSYKYCVRAIGSVKSAFGGSAYKQIRFLSAPLLKKIISTEYGVTVSWNKVSGADGYIVYRKAGSGSFEELAIVSGDTLKYRDKTAEKGVTYTYKVYATRGSYISSYKSTLKITDSY